MVSVAQGPQGGLERVCQRLSSGFRQQALGPAPAPSSRGLGGLTVTLQTPWGAPVWTGVLGGFLEEVTFPRLLPGAEK